MNYRDDLVAVILTAIRGVGMDVPVNSLMVISATWR
jgi:hypothetical protein